jgi:hypothetical protein
MRQYASIRIGRRRHALQAEVLSKKLKTEKEGRGPT